MRCRSLVYRPPGPGGFTLGPLDLEGPDERPWLILGRSGSGKSTLLRLLAGVTVPTFGSIEGPSRETSAYLPQLAERALAGRNLAEDLCGTIRPPHARRSELRRALAGVGLRGVPLSRRSKDLSLGERRRLALALLLVSRRPHWALDEPDAGLDRDGSASLKALLTTHPAGAGSQRWIATFRLSLYASFHPWGIVLDKGSLLAQGELKELVELPPVRAVLGIDERPVFALQSALRDRWGERTQGEVMRQLQALLADSIGLR